MQIYDSLLSKSKFFNDYFDIFLIFIPIPNKMFAERFTKILKDKGLNPNKLAAKLGTTRATVANICDGKHSPSVEKLNSLLTIFPDINVYWLITGRGSMYLNETQPGDSLVEEPVQHYEAHAMTNLREEIQYLKELNTTLTKMNKLYEEKINQLEQQIHDCQLPDRKKNAG